MSPHARVLLVSSPGGAAATLASGLASAGHEPVVASDFATARILLDESPGLLIADVKLAAYNGLHLAIRAAGAGIPALVIGDPDPVLQAEAERQRATYLTLPLDPERALTMANRLLESARHTRRSTRTPVPDLEAFADNLPVRVVDVNYDGMRIETGAQPSPLPPFFLLRLPQFDFVCRVQRVWTAPTSSADAPERIWCGVAVAGTSTAWRSLVDDMRPADSRL